MKRGTMTIAIPIGNRHEKKTLGFREVTGDVIGPFLVHKEHWTERLWVVTHIGTGFQVQGSLENKARATWLAKRLAEIDVWMFTDPEAVKELSQDVLAKIKVLRADAKHGDMQGTGA